MKSTMDAQLSCSAGCTGWNTAPTAYHVNQIQGAGLLDDGIVDADHLPWDALSSRTESATIAGHHSERQDFVPITIPWLSSSWMR